MSVQPLSTAAALPAQWNRPAQALAGALRARKGELARRMLPQVLDGWDKFTTQVEALQGGTDEFIRRELLAFPDYLSLYFQTGDEDYKSLYIGEKRKQFYDAKLDAEARVAVESRILEADAAALRRSGGRGRLRGAGAARHGPGRHPPGHHDRGRAETRHYPEQGFPVVCIAVFGEKTVFLVPKTLFRIMSTRCPANRRLRASRRSRVPHGALPGGPGLAGDDVRYIEEPGRAASAAQGAG